MNSSVSVVIPTYDDSDTIFRAISSVLNQTRLPLEIIIVNDSGCKDYCRFLDKLVENLFCEIAINIIHLPSNKGASHARNLGWKISKGEYVAFLDADDTWHPRKLEIQISEMLEHGAQVMGCRADRYEVDECGSILNYSIKLCSLSKFLLSNQFTTTSSVILRADTKFQFDETQAYSEDYLLWLNLLDSGERVFYIDLCLSYYHKPLYGSSGLSESLFSMYKGELLVYKKAMGGTVFKRLCLPFLYFWSSVKFLGRYFKVLMDVS